MIYDERYEKGMTVLAEKDGVSILGEITAVNAEMTYEITSKNGDQRSVDHGHITAVLPKPGQL